MGEDIHSKVLIYSKIEKKYIDGLSFTTYPEESNFGPLFTDRNYNLFSLFGSRRSSLPELNYGNYGIPSFLPKTYKSFLSNSDYYGYIYWNISDFKKSINEYIERMRDPKKFFESDDNLDCELNQYYDANLGEINIQEYDKEMNFVFRSLMDMKKQISCMENDIDEYKFGKYIDIEKTIFLFYFDC